MTMVIATLLFLGTVGGLQMSAKAIITSQKQMKIDRALNYAQKRIEETPFIYIMSSYASDKNGLDSTSNYSDRWATSPLKDLYWELDRVAKDAGGTGFQIGVAPLFRDTGDFNNDGRTSDVVTWLDYNTQLARADPNATFVQRNGDGDYRDYVVDSSGTLRSETPNSHYKDIALMLTSPIGGDNSLGKRRFRISREKLSGEQNDPTADVFKLTISPINCTSLYYSRSTQAQLDSWNLRNSFVYATQYATLSRAIDNPSGPLAPTQYFRVSGNTEPNATVTLSTIPKPGPGSFTESYTIGTSGSFTLDFPQYSAFLNANEGRRWTYIRATKGTRSSISLNHNYADPNIYRAEYVDLTPPQIPTISPLEGTTVKTRTPAVYYIALDTASVSAVSYGAANNTAVDCTSSFPGSSRLMAGNMVLKVNGTTRPLVTTDLAPACTYQMKKAVLVTTGTAAGSGLPVALNDNTTYAFEAQANDLVGYGVKSTWTITVDLGPAGAFDTDGTAPVITTVSKSGTQMVFDLGDPDSGVNPYSIVVTKVSGPATTPGNTVWLSQSVPTNTALGAAYNAEIGRVTLNGTLPNGAYQFRIQANHWSATLAPLDFYWDFSIP
jgi:hypothetical protein